MRKSRYKKAFYTTLFRTILDHLHGQYNEYFEILNSTLKSFRHISPLTIGNFSQTEADELTALIPGIDDSSQPDSYITLHL
ncbi:unnamed protein product [Didymodactylos carnosus]|uniref:Uncharacterized protein n=1 Tax=Didymodactylos carnosus TaxID=1234261 RepID=A0A816GLB9_9BILA|nr:unnamed protein product [Didymodactylos carnosus]CAF1675529.1 unnamed protein product [Didymodactylos carnosus]CAF4157239.1 unnamed protein product [Didymodactylos carnosus]CAF4661775.1 unnamed protein product [Didymodactylos carnosus]